MLPECVLPRDGMSTGLRCSVVVPAYNEEGSVQALHDELRAVLERMTDRYEIIFVDDGSTDQTAGVLRGLAAGSDKVRLVEFVRNFGKSAAYTAGFTAASGDVVLTLDADLQDDPAEIPGLLEKLGEGFDLVIGRKVGRMGNEPLKALPSTFFNRAIAAVFGLKLNDINCGFRAMSRQVAKNLVLYGDLYRFIPILANVQGFRVAQVEVRHRKRVHGHSKYGAHRFWTSLLDLLTVRFITTYAPQRPLHFFGALGLGLFVPGIMIELYVLTDRLFFGGSLQVHVAAIIIGVLLMLMGFQCVVTGLIGEMFNALPGKQRYLLKSDPGRAATPQAGRPL